MASHVNTYHQKCVNLSHVIKEQEEKSLTKAQSIFDNGKETVVSGLDIVASCGKSMNVHLESLIFEADSLSNQMTALKADCSSSMAKILEGQQKDLISRLNCIESLIKNYSEKVIENYLTCLLTILDDF